MPIGLTMLVGGPENGRLVEVNLDVDQLYFQEAGALCRAPNPEPDKLPVHAYRRRQIGCLDGWIQVVYVHEAISWNELTQMPEERLVGIVMAIWRARHRRRALVLTSPLTSQLVPADASTRRR